MIPKDEDSGNAAPLRVTLSAGIALDAPADFAALEQRWADFAAVADASFFQGAAWIFCRAADRFPDPVLLEARADGQTLALGLFNRRRGRRGGLWLGESGIAALDSVYIEHNGLLFVGASDEAALLAACLRAACAFSRRVVLSGVDDAHLAAARVIAREGRGVVRLIRTHAAPFVDLARIRATGEKYLGGLSGNTRYQIRRSARRYAAAGTLRIARARDAAEAHRFLDALAVLHQSTWTARGKPGAFAGRDFARFHHALIDRAPPTDAKPIEDGQADGVDLLRIEAGNTVVGYLYNFRHRGRAYAYQSGFDYGPAGAQRKPGLTCHHLAIEMYAAEGANTYDFLAGGDRYKTSLANATAALHWLEILPRWSLRGMLERLRGARA